MTDTARKDGLPELLPCPFCGGKPRFEPYKRDGLTLRCGSLGCIRRDQRTMRNSIDWLRSEMTKDWNRRASPSVGGVRVPDALSEHPRSSSYDQGWADGFTHCRDEVLRLNPAAEVGEVEKIADQFADKPWTPGVERLGISTNTGYAKFARRLAGSGKENGR